jgi:PII-like signaling protein
MKPRGECRLLRIYIGESDRWRHKPLYDELVRLARDQGLAGATVLRGFEGYGARALLHTTRILSLSEDLPLVIEVVDRPDRIEAFLEAAADMLAGALVTVERVDVRAFPTGPAAPGR